MPDEEPANTGDQLGYPVMPNKAVNDTAPEEIEITPSIHCSKPAQPT